MGKSSSSMARPLALIQAKYCGRDDGRISNYRKLRQLLQEQPRALNRLADAELLLHVPYPRGDWMDHRHSHIFLRRHHVDNAPGAGAEKIDALSVGVFDERSLKMMVNLRRSQIARFTW